MQRVLRQFANLMRQGKTRAALNLARTSTDPLKFLKRPASTGATRLGEMLAQKERSLRAVGKGFPRAIGDWSQRGEFKNLVSPKAVEGRVRDMRHALPEGTAKRLNRAILFHDVI